MYERLKAGRAVNLTASGAITAAAGTSILGFYVNSTNAGTLVIKDGGTDGTALTGTITPAIGWHFLPVTGGSPSGLYATIAGTALNVTFVVMPAA